MSEPVTESVVDRIRSVAHSAPGRVPFSVEFFPPKTPAGEEKQWEAVRAFESLGAAFASVTYGAGGSNRARNNRIVGRIAAETSLLPVGHLTAVNHSRAELAEIARGFVDVGVSNILALRGDPPGDPLGIWRKHPEGVEYAVELVAMLKDAGDYHVGVAAFPGGHFRAPSLEADTRFTLDKYRAGARYAISQIFFDVEQFLRMRDRLVKADPELGSRPLIPSVMPVTSLTTARKMVELSGSRMPRWVERRLAEAAGYYPSEGAAENTARVREVGCDMAVEMCDRLIAEGVPCLHFDTLNSVGPVKDVLLRVGLAREEPTTGGEESQTGENRR